MNKLQSLFSLLHHARYLHFLFTGVTGVALNMLITWSLTEFVFGVERYYIGYIAGTIVNITYNFILNSILTFKTRRKHAERFIQFILFNLASTLIQFMIVHELVLYVGHTYYLPIIASTIFILSVLSFLFFKHALFNEGKVEHLTPGEEFALARAWFRSAGAQISHFFSFDKNVILFIIVLAMMTRLPYLSFPNITLFDEVIYVGYTIKTIDQAPFFDIHPPLARMIFAEFVDDIPEPTPHIVPSMNPNQSFGNFPYVPLRALVALFGILLPLIVYGIGRTIGYRPLVAAVPALFIVFDNAFIIYSRAILPDMLMLVANFAGLLLILAALKTVNIYKKISLVLLAGILLGLGISFKWTALGILGLAALWLLARRLWSFAFTILAIASLIYVAVFYVNFAHFKNGGKIEPVLSAYSVPYILNVSYPEGDDVSGILRFIPEFQTLMLESNRDEKITSQIQSAPMPLSWPIARAKMVFWLDAANEKSIVLGGNSIIWGISFFILLFEVGWVTAMFIRDRKWAIDETETLLLIGYFANYLPFFLIDRSMFIYHYFPSLIILFLLLPRVVPRIIHCIQLLSNDKYIGYALAIMLCVLGLINFILLAPSTYGF